MKLADAKSQFIASWGAFGTHWGINRTMAQIHALLLVSAEPINQDDIMAQLNISRGNVNMNIRELIDWGLVDRILLPGERKEHFSAEKDIWKVAVQIVKERKKREKNPAKVVRPDWSPKDHGLEALMVKHPHFAEKVSIVKDDEPHVIDLLDEVGI